MNRRWTARLIIGTGFLVATLGCNPFSLAYFLSGGPRDIVPPEFALTPVKPKKEATVLVLTSLQVGLSPDLIGVDELLTAELLLAMKGFARESKEEFDFVPAAKVKAYKSDNVNWHLKKRAEIGAEFEADYVIDIQVGQMRLTKPGSRDLLQGRAEIAVTAYDMAKPDEPPFTTEKSVTYPRTFEKHATDITMGRFKKEFVKEMAKEVAFYFVSHPYDDEKFRPDRAE